MATVSSADPAQPVNLALAWALVVAGLSAATGWILFAQHLGDTITITAVGAAMTVYYALLFLPLIALAFLLGMVGHQRVARRGSAAAHWAMIAGALGLAGLLTTLGFAAINGGVVRGPGVPFSAGLVLLGVALTLLQVSTEELLFRGWLQPALIERIGVPLGIVLGAALFAAFHLPSGVRAPLSLVNLMLGGVWFGLLAQRSGGLVAPIAAHFAWNAVEDLGFGLTPNPGTGALGSWINLDLTGLSLWGAQADGLNASIGTTIVLAALIVPLAWPLMARKV